MNKHAPWFVLVTLLFGCQTTAGPAPDDPGTSAAGSAATFEQKAIDLTQDGRELVLSQVHVGRDRKVALIIRYSERPESGGHCTLSIIEQAEDGPVIVEASDQVVSCRGMSVPDATAVKGGLEAKVEADFIRLDEDRIRNRSEYEFVRTKDGRWHLAYTADIGPEHDADTGELLVVSYAVAYQIAMEGPTVSEVDRNTIDKARERSVY